MLFRILRFIVARCPWIYKGLTWDVRWGVFEIPPTEQELAQFERITVKYAPLRLLRSEIRHHFLNVRIEIDPPAKRDGDWFLDVYAPWNAPHPIVVQWSGGDTFGISIVSDDNFFFTKPDETYDSLAKVFDRMCEIIRSRGLK